MRATPSSSVALVLLISTTLSGCTLLEGGGGLGLTGGAWSHATHPCVGNRTDAMWFDDASTGYVGCGSTTQGFGLYTTTDAGQSWASVAAPNDFFASFRVNSLSRAADGKLYIGGIGSNGARVVSLDASGTLGEKYLTPSSGVQTWQSFQVGTFRMDSAGRAVSESLTGSDVMFWSSATAEPVDGYGWWNQTTIEGNGAQILDLEVFGDRFYGVGSTISQPPYFFFEPASGMGTGFAMEALKLSGDGLSAFTAEVWDIAIDSTGKMLLSGVNESTNTAVAWFSTGDPTQASSWTMVDFTQHIPDAANNRTRLYGGCREGDLLVVVGDYSQRADALALLSRDAGQSWQLLDPSASSSDGVGPLSKCQIVGDKVYITGADGYFGILDPAAL